MTASAAPADEEYCLKLPNAAGEKCKPEGASDPTAPAPPGPIDAGTEGAAAPTETAAAGTKAPGSGPEDHGLITTSEPMGRLDLAAPGSDPLLDGPMLAVLGGLVLITAAGVWLALRRRRRLSAAT